VVDDKPWAPLARKVGMTVTKTKVAKAIERLPDASR
jgi:hypothetical protein